MSAPQSDHGLPPAATGDKRPEAASTTVERQVLGDRGPDARTLVLFHRDADGFASAVAAWCALGEKGVRYLSVQYDEPVPAELDAEKLAASLDRGAPPIERVFIVDFSYRRALLEEWARCGVKVIVLDHHKTAAEELKELMGGPWQIGEGATIDCWFDMNQAGCELAWDYFSRAENQSEDAPAAEVLAAGMPSVLTCIAIRDLWKHAAMPRDQREFVENLCARMELEPWDFARWHELAVRWQSGDPVFRLDLERQGKAVMAYKHLVAKSQAQRWHLLNLRGVAMPVPACNAAYLASETAHALLEAVTSADFVAVYAVEPKGYRVSLRARPGGPDVSAIAKRYPGGGGHAAAAGFFYPAGLPDLENERIHPHTQANGEPWWQDGERSPSAIDQAVMEYIDTLTMPMGEDGDYDYEPTGFERWLIYQAICGIECDLGYKAAVTMSAEAARALPGAATEKTTGASCTPAPAIETLDLVAELRAMLAGPGNGVAAAQRIERHVAEVVASHSEGGQS